MVDVKCLSDDELQNELDKFGFSPGPILPSTRKVYERKLLVQLLVSTPCASPEMNGPRELDRAQDFDDSEELNATIILKGNIIFSSEKSKGPKKRPKASTSKPKALEDFCLDSKRSKGRRCAARASDVRFKAWNNIRENACCVVNRRAGSRNIETFPVGLKLAVFGIFITVIFVYITVEGKPLFG
ncbi:PREDICTED: LOW QUALITY PROTEIN: LEM domain-containing protein 1 [Lipotes vexillifer]|uniref:LOW QUALITY PROTEIN: LEM domain-containing protein 1 n=1 Tax=Lipotes vexillifer TaxID=118797 RepID=A0A340YFI0_LIPVE|nr:PREDICTED: LOW QUALITY PROTEIN: LEM domain-containing protein 1 [Lipotes vexillifer]